MYVMIEVEGALGARSGRLVNRGNALSSHRSDARSYRLCKTVRELRKVWMGEERSASVVVSDTFHALD